MALQSSLTTKSSPRGGRATTRRRPAGGEPPSPALLDGAYTSREAAYVAAVPFFTVDYWDRSRFLVPTVAKGRGRGKGRQRLYSFADLLRLRIARELRERQVSLTTLRVVVDKLAGAAADLPGAAFVVVGDRVESAADGAALATLLKRPGRGAFAVLLDLREMREGVAQRAAEVVAARAHIR